MRFLNAEHRLGPKVNSNPNLPRRRPALRYLILGTVLLSHSDGELDLFCGGHGNGDDIQGLLVKRDECRHSPLLLGVKLLEEAERIPSSACTNIHG